MGDALRKKRSASQWIAAVVFIASSDGIRPAFMSAASVSSRRSPGERRAQHNSVGPAARMASDRVSSRRRHMELIAQSHGQEGADEERLRAGVPHCAASLGDRQHVAVPFAERVAHRMRRWPACAPITRSCRRTGAVGMAAAMPLAEDCPLHQRRHREGGKLRLPVTAATRSKRPPGMRSRSAKNLGIAIFMASPQGRFLSTPKL